MFFWASIIYVEINHSYSMYQKLAHETAVAYTKAVKDFRIWIARHDGVYVPTTELTPPNPFLNTNDRIIRADNGMELTKLNPAYAARQLSELSQESSIISFKIVSQNPVNPKNIADTWENQALQHYRESETVTENDHKFEIVTNENGIKVFRSLKPIYIVDECTGCHVEKGNNIGDLRGGISVSFPYASYEEGRKQHVIRNLTVYFISFITSMMFIMYFGRKLLVAKEAHDKLFDQIEYIAHTDKLTGLPNRHYFMMRLENEIQRYIRHRSKLALLMIDLNSFKYINDTFGHMAGDLVLQKVAEVIAKTARTTDVCGRIGGDEFVVMLTESDKEAAITFANRLHEQIEQTYVMYEDNRLDILVSIGVSIIEEVNISSSLDETTIQYLRDKLIQQADDAMYAAKDVFRAHGGSHVACYNDMNCKEI